MIEALGQILVALLMTWLLPVLIRMIVAAPALSYKHGGTWRYYADEAVLFWRSLFWPVRLVRHVRTTSSQLQVRRRIYLDRQTYLDRRFAEALESVSDWSPPDLAAMAAEAKKRVHEEEVAARRDRMRTELKTMYREHLAGNMVNAETAISRVKADRRYEELILRNAAELNSDSELTRTLAGLGKLAPGRKRSPFLEGKPPTDVSWIQMEGKR